MEFFAHTVTAEFLYDGVAIAFSVYLNGMTNITQSRARLHLFYAQHHAFVGDFCETLGMRADFTHHEHAAGIAVIAIFDDGDINVQHVAFFQGFVIGNTMANHMVN